MKYIRRWLRPLAILLLANFIQSLFAPTLSLAVTGGPGQSEFTSFEAYGGTQMVNPLTGDFTYNMPLLHVPGPGGGYSLPLFYHGGIKVDQVASWTGLGWNINPGSINRNIMGHPDDAHDRPVRKYAYNLLVDEDNYSLQMTAGFAGATVGANFDWGTNQSFSSSPYLHSASLSPIINGLKSKNNQSSPVGVPSDLSTSVFIQKLGISVPVGAFNFATTYSHTNFKAFISTNITKHAFGSLYMTDAYDNVTGADGNTYQSMEHTTDVYSNPFNALKHGNSLTEEDAARLAYPAYDQYRVNAQGLGGIMSPQLNQPGSLPRDGKLLTRFENATSYEKRVVFLNPDAYSINNLPEVNFRFRNETSSSLLSEPGSWQIPNPTSNYQNPATVITHSSGSFSHSDFFNTTTNQMGTKTPTVWLSNDEINSGSAKVTTSGLIKYSPIESTQAYPQVDPQKRSDPEFFDPKGIGAFVITTENGVKYHFALPVYQFESVAVRTNYQNPNDNIYVEPSVNPYAYTWLLTAITGADFVDRNGNQQADEGDWGYWVNFDYGKWTDGYLWRTLYSGTESITGGNEVYTQGRKQVYYLNSVQTATHTAYFVKSLRKDALGSLGTSILHTAKPFESKRIYIPNSKTDMFGTTIQAGAYEPRDEVNFGFTSNKKAELLKLDKIILIQNTVNPLDKSSGTALSDPAVTLDIDVWHRDQYISSTTGQTTNFFYNYHIDKTVTNLYNSDQILDINDLATNSGFLNQALQIIEFDYNDPNNSGDEYRLAKGTPNSTGTEGGKLTLHKVIRKGKGNTSVMPAINFDYYDLGGYDDTSEDLWGYYREAGIENSTSVKDLHESMHIKNWSLKSVQIPSGGYMHIDYEPDTYIKEAIYNKNEVSFDYSLAYFDNNPPNLSPYGKAFGAYVNVSTEEAGFISQLLNDNPNAYITVKFPDLNFVTSANCDPNTNCAPSCACTTVVVNASELGGEWDVSQNRVYFGPFTPCFQDDCAIELGFSGEIEVIIQNEIELKGGGVKVSKIEIEDENGNIYTSTWDYTHPETGRTSGVTAYAPRKKDRFIPFSFEIPGPGVMYEYVTITQKASDLSKSSEGSTRYKFETLGTPNSIENAEFQLGNIFEVEDVSGGDKLNDYYHGNVPLNDFANTKDDIYERNSVIHDKMAYLGRPLEVSVLDNHGIVLSKRTYEYVSPEDTEIGVVQESFSEVKRYQTSEDASYTKTNSNWYFINSSKKIYPNVLKAITSQSNNLISKVEYTDWDKYTGQPTITYTENSYGEKFKNEVEYLHTKSGFSGMGPTVTDQNNHNLLGVVGYSETSTSSSTLPFDQISDWKQVSASAQMWSEDWNYREWNGSSYNLSAETNADRKIWRPWRSYAWKGFLNTDGTYDNSFSAFSFTNPTSNGWQQISEVTLYDRFSHALEAKDLNDTYAASKLGYGDNMRTLASSSNARYTEFAYSGAEDHITGTNYFGSEVENANVGTTTDPQYVHTGKHALYMSSSDQYGFTYQGDIGTADADKFKPSRIYRASVWVKGEQALDASSIGLYYSIKQGGKTGSSLKWEQATVESSNTFKAGDWYLLSIDVPVGDYPAGDFLEICTWRSGGGSYDVVYTDDFRVHPVDAPMTSYVYNPQTGEVTAVLDNENIATRYTYDDAGRIVKIEQETKDGFRRVQESKHHYARPLE